MDKNIDILLNGGTTRDKDVAACNLQKIVSNYETIVETLGKEFKALTGCYHIMPLKKRVKLYRDELIGKEQKKHIEVKMLTDTLEVMIFFYGFNVKFNIPFYDENGINREEELEDFVKWFRRK